jgi:hypothetical protein
MQTIIVFIKKNIDIKMGIAGAVVMAVIVFYINYHGSRDTLGASTAALKQGGYTFLFGGIIMRMSERISLAISVNLIAIALACIIPSAISILLTYGLHSLKGTPKPLQSTLVTAFFVIPSTLIWAFIQRQKKKKTNPYQ